MRRTHNVVFFLAAALAACVSLVAMAQQGPKAVPAEPIKDFDIVPKGELIEHTFVIRNEGDAALEITEVRPACGCTVAEFDKSIAPGEAGKVSIKLKTDNFAGPISKPIAVFTNDSDNPKLQLVVKAQVKPYVTIIPGFARYNYVQGEAVETIPQTLWAEDGSPLGIVSVKAPYDHLKVTYRQATEEERNDKGGEQQWRLEFSLSPNAPVGALRDYVVVELDHPKQKTAKIPISGFVRPRQHITPAKVDFGQLEGDNLPQRRTLHFTSFISDGIELTEVETGVDGLEAEVVPSENQPGYRFKLVLTIGPEVPKGAFDSVIKIHTTDTQNPIVELPVKGTVL